MDQSPCERAVDSHDARVDVRVLDHTAHGVSELLGLAGAGGQRGALNLLCARFLALEREHWGNHYTCKNKLYSMVAYILKY